MNLHYHYIATTGKSKEIFEGDFNLAYRDSSNELKSLSCPRLTRSSESAEELLRLAAIDLAKVLLFAKNNVNPSYAECEKFINQTFNS